MIYSSFSLSGQCNEWCFSFFFFAFASITVESGKLCLLLSFCFLPEIQSSFATQDCLIKFASVIFQLANISVQSVPRLSFGYVEKYKGNRAPKWLPFIEWRLPS